MTTRTIRAIRAGWLALIMAAPMSVDAMQEEFAVQFGTYLRFQSKVLDEERPILVYTPESYLETQERYPVVYAIVGDSMGFAEIVAATQISAYHEKAPAVIVVGIVDTQHIRDLFPVKLPGRDEGGGAANFQAFLSQELVPHFDENYRTQPFRVLYGASNAGLFTINVLLSEPGAFNAYIAASPMLGWCQEHVFETARKTLSAKKDVRGSLYVIYGADDYDKVTEVVPKFHELIRSMNLKSFDYKRVIVEDGGHVPYGSLYEGLAHLFDGMKFPESLAKEKGLEAVERYYEKLSKRIGFEIRAPKEGLTNLGIGYLRDGEAKKAHAVFDFMMRQFPTDPTGAYFKARLFLREKEPKQAKRYLQQALSLQPGFPPALKLKEKLANTP